MENFSALNALGTTEKSRFLGRTYGWMSVALLASAISAFLTVVVSLTPQGLAHFFANTKFVVGDVSSFGMFLFRMGMWIFIIAELAIVFFLSAKIRSMSHSTAKLLFFVYSILNGISLSSIFIVYKLGSVATIFLGAAAMFGLMSWWGAKTDRDLSSIGRYCTMGLVGLVVASVLQVVLSLIFKTTFGAFDFLISLAGIAIFTGLTAYDTQKLVRLAENSNGSEDFAKVSIIAALDLYLDFVNIFIYLLRLFGKRR